MDKIAQIRIKINRRLKLAIFNLISDSLCTEAAVRRCFSKNVFLKISNIHRKTPVLESVFKGTLMQI